MSFKRSRGRDVVQSVFQYMFFIHVLGDRCLLRERDVGLERYMSFKRGRQRERCLSRERDVFEYR